MFKTVNLTFALINYFCRVQLCINIPGGSNKLLSDASGAAVPALAVIGLALALVTGVTTVPPFDVTLFMADRVASLTSLNLSIN